MAGGERRSPGGTPPELATQMRRRQFATLLQHSPDATIIVDGTGLICEWNPAAETMLGRQRAEVVGGPVTSLVPEENRAQFDAAWAELAAGRAAPASLTNWIRPDGSSVHVTTHVALIRADGAFAGAVAIIRKDPLRQVPDAAPVHSAEVAAEQTSGGTTGGTKPQLGALEWDELTALPGRRHLLRRLAEPIPPGLTRGVAVVDVDGFALVNEAYGPDAGDDVLRDLAQRLVTAGDSGDVGRWQADSFVWITDAVDPVAALDELSVRVSAALDEPFVLGGDRLWLTVSSGMVTSTLAPDLDLLAAAMDALRVAKESGRDRALWYLPAHRTSSTGAFRLANDLHRGIENDELRLHFQPIIELATNAVVGVEALVRWERPGVGLLGPVSFIEMAERTGQIVLLGAWVARHACAAAAGLAQRADGPGVVSINLSARQLSDPGLVDMLRHAITDSGCAPSAIVVEVTETALTYDLGAATATLEAIKALGVGLDLDDFGTGYSSLLYLKHFPVDRIKIDQVLRRRPGFGLRGHRDRRLDDRTGAQHRDPGVGRGRRDTRPARDPAPDGLRLRSGLPDQPPGRARGAHCMARPARAGSGRTPLRGRRRRWRDGTRGDDRTGPGGRRARRAGQQPRRGGGHPRHRGGRARPQRGRAGRRRGRA